MPITPLPIVSNITNFSFFQTEEDRKYMYSTIETVIKILNKLGFDTKNIQCEMGVDKTGLVFNCDFYHKPEKVDTFISLARKAILMEDLDETSDKNTK